MSAMMLTILATYAYLGLSSRYLADDFCTAGDVARLGFWGAQTNLYRTWSGRFSFSFVVALTHLFGPAITPFLPAFTIVLWIAGFSYLMYQWMLLVVGVRHWAFSILLAVISISVILSASPNLYQSLYWQTGMLTYLFPLVLFTAYLGFLFWIARTGNPQKPSAAVVLLGLILPFFMGGFSETFVSVQTAALAALIVLILLFRSTTTSARLSLVVVLGFLGSLLALALIVAAPGNAIRRALLPSSPGLQELVQATLKDWYIFTARTIKWHFLGIGLLSATSAFLGFVLFYERPDHKQPKVRFRANSLVLVATPVLTFLLMCASIAPYEFAVSSFPDARVLITTLYIFLLGISGWSYILGQSAALLDQSCRLISGIFLTSISVLCLGLGLIYTRQTLNVALEDRSKMANYAEAWDERDRTLREAAEKDLSEVAAASLPHMGGGLAEIGFDPDEWINRCVASTYGLDQVIAK
jgi:hypothetical protein